MHVLEHLTEDLSAHRVRIGNTDLLHLPPLTDETTTSQLEAHHNLLVHVHLRLEDKLVPTPTIQLLTLDVKHERFAAVEGS